MSLLFGKIRATSTVPWFSSTKLANPSKKFDAYSLKQKQPTIQWNKHSCRNFSTPLDNSQKNLPSTESSTKTNTPAVNTAPTSEFQHWEIIRKIEKTPEGRVMHFQNEVAVDDGDFVKWSDSPGATRDTDTEPIDMIAKVPPIEVHARNVWCEGGGGALGHPKIYINLDRNKPVSCGYCGLRFVQMKHEHSHH